MPTAVRMDIEQATNVSHIVRERLRQTVLADPLAFDYVNLDTLRPLCVSAANMAIDEVVARGVAVDQIHAYAFWVTLPGYFTHHYLIGLHGDGTFAQALKIDPTATQFGQEQTVFPAGEYVSASRTFSPQRVDAVPLEQLLVVGRAESYRSHELRKIMQTCSTS